MNCERCQAELEDFLYGELSDSRTSEIRSHLTACGACAAVRDALESENELFAHYYEQTAIDPPAEMWEVIRDRIRAQAVRQPQKERAGGWMSGATSAGLFAWLFRPALLRQASFAILLIVLSVAVTTLILNRDKKDSGEVASIDKPPASTSPQPSATIAPELPPSPKPTQPVKRRVEPPVKRLSEQEVINLQIARAEREYQNAINMLDRAIAKRKDTFDPELIRQYESSLALIDSSIAASRRAMRERPTDLAAGQFLLAAYARKVELMQDIAMR
ncbi:MAG: zf-HC2 domain-containing protein [Acidobacteria bacterium]|nr:zf-HC2 domain-containing protein [Acidobacteriota bacterium]